MVRGGRGGTGAEEGDERKKDGRKEVRADEEDEKSE